jgi:hypothetical protein
MVLQALQVASDHLITIDGCDSTLITPSFVQKIQQITDRAPNEFFVVKGDVNRRALCIF